MPTTRQVTSLKPTSGQPSRSRGVSPWANQPSAVCSQLRLTFESSRLFEAAILEGSRANRQLALVLARQRQYCRLPVLLHGSLVERREATGLPFVLGVICRYVSGSP